MRRIQWDITTHVHRSTSKSARYSNQILLNLEFSRQIFEKKTLKYQISWKCVQWGPIFFFHAGERRGKRTYMMALIVVFRNFANAPKNEAKDECTYVSVGTHRVLCHYQCSSTDGPRLNLCPSANFTYRNGLFCPTTTPKTTTTTTLTISTAAAAVTVTRGKLQVKISRFRAEWSGFESRQVQRIFPFSKTPRPALGPTWTPTQGALLDL